MLVRNLSLIVCFLFGTTTLCAQYSDLSLDDGWVSEERAKKDSVLMASHEYYKNTDHWTFYVDPFVLKTHEDTEFDEYGLKHAYFIRGFAFIAEPKPSEYLLPKSIRSFWSYWRKLPTQGKDPQYFAQIRSAVLPMEASKYPNVSSDSLFQQYVDVKFDEDIRYIVQNYVGKQLACAKEYVLFPTSEYYYLSDPFPLPFSYYDRALYLLKEGNTRYSDNIYLCKTSIPINEPEDIIPFYGCSNFQYTGCGEDALLGELDIPNTDYYIMDDNTIAFFSTKYGAFEWGYAPWISSRISQTDSIISFHNKSKSKIEYNNLKNLRDTITFISPNLMVVKGEKYYNIVHDKNSILHLLKGDTYLYNYYAKKQSDKLTRQDSAIAHHFEYINECIQQYDYYLNYFDKDSHLDTISLTEQQQNQIRKEYLKLSQLDAQLDQIRIQSETYYKVQYKDSKECIVEKQQNLYSLDESGSVVAPKYRKKVEKIEKEKEKTVNKLEKMGVKVYSSGGILLY